MLLVRYKYNEEQNISTVRTVKKSNRKIVKRYKIDTPNKQIHDISLSWLDTGTSIKSGRIKLVLWAQASTLSEMIRSCYCFLFRPFGFIASKTLNYLAFQSFDFERT